MDSSKTFSLQENLFTENLEQKHSQLQFFNLIGMDIQKEENPIYATGAERQAISIQMKFYQEFKKVYRVSYCLHKQKLKLAQQLQKIEKRISAFKSLESLGKKYRCDKPKCDRIYCTKQALNQHVKSKHPSQNEPLESLQQYEDDVDSS